MSDESAIQDSAVAISVEIGLDLTYFSEAGEKNLIHIPVLLGYVLLHWFLEGVVTGVGEGVGEGIDRGAARATRSLGERVKRLFGRHDRSSEADAKLQAELAAQASVAVSNARAAVVSGAADEIARVAEAYEIALVGYLTDEGMPGRDALRIAQRVRAEAGVQLRAVAPSR
ncbi:MAG TPA: hypothetical protein VE992_05355 [Solirubrobacteraceae bacterium]|nr:hypothetical protein [Solirubrobacteraceae bacterium]